MAGGVVTAIAKMAQPSGRIMAGQQPTGWGYPLKDGRPS
ncbi:MAG: hypothetical protein JWP17_2753 [Solirubrobacterales bacterium]|nr:hypothetical protein [Solirubrobacterales bacterium]